MTAAAVAAEEAPVGRLPLACSEVALLLVHLAVVGGFFRLYEDGSFLGPLVGFVVGAHALAVVSRRVRIPAPVAALVAVVGAVLATSWLVFPATTRFGLPTGETLDVAREALRLSRSRFEEVAAPAPVFPGFQLAAGLALWVSVWFADWAAFRLRATVEAVAPPTVLFVFGALLGSGDHQVASAAAFTGAVLLFASTHRALRAQVDQAWLTASPSTGPLAVLRAGVVLAVVALVGGVVVGPRLPGTGAEALVELRGDQVGGGDRTTVSPIVDLRKRLVNQTDTELFTVTAERSSYWRLTALDRFDGQLWRSGGEFAAAEGDLSHSTPDIERVRANRQTITIRALSAIWVPTAFEASTVEQSSQGLRWDPESSTLIVEDTGGEQENTSDGLQYTVVSELPDLDPGQLRAAPTSDDEAIEDRYEGLPGDFPRSAADAARDVTAAADTRFDQAIALQDWFRTTFTYSLDVEAGHSDDALVDFLETRRGYCEQFAGAYAAMARSLGIPSRVAVGFTPGDAAQGPAEDGPTEYTVLGRHAHAWPEIWFPGIGWVPFEPTPGRGIPDAQDYTNVPEEQDDREATITPVPTSTTTTAAEPTSTTVAGSTAPGTTQPERTTTAAAPTDGPDRPSGLVQAAVALAALVAAFLAAVLLAPAVRARRRGGAAAAAGVLDAWHQALAPVRWLTGLRPRPAETHLEFSRRAASPLGDLDGRLQELAGLATSASWDPAGASPVDADRAAALADALRHEVRRRQSIPTRAWRRLSWREAFGFA